MPAPATVEEFLDLVRKSGVVAAGDLDSFVRDRGGVRALPSDPHQLAGVLVREQVLTHFQAEQVLRGRWRGFTIGKYRVLQSIGSGGMGDVYLCEDVALRRRVAIKVLPPAKAADPLTLKRFHREARILTLLDHPNLVRAYDVGQDGQLYFLVMEYLEGTPFQALVDKGGPLPADRAANYICQAARGLQYFHEAGLVHRDIKPGNILVDARGGVKILDMGLARFFQGTTEAITEQFDDRSVLGTADYLSPEQARSSSGVDIRTDIYSLGATFYFLLAGKPPFAEGTIAQKLIWHQMKPPRSIRELRPEVPAEMAAIIERMLAKDPAQRYPTPGALADALARWGPPPIAGSRPAPALPEDEPFATLLDEEEASLTETPAPSPRTFKETGIRSQPAPRPADAFTDLVMPAPPPRGQPNVEQRAVSIRARRWAIIAGAAVVVLGFTGLLWGLLSSHSRPAPSPHVQLLTAEASHPPAPPAASMPARLFVSRWKQPNSYPTIREALAHARPGDRIVVLETLVEETLRLVDGQLGKHVSIEGGPSADKLVVWRAPAGMKEHQPLLELANVPGLRLEGFLFDGQDRVDDLAVIAGNSPGLALTNIQFQGFKRSGLRLAGCAGEEKRPVALTRLRFLAGKECEAGLTFAAPLTHVDRHVQLRDCRFEGPGMAGIRLAGSVDRVVCQRNRFFKTSAGVLYTKGESRHTVHLSLLSNTFCDVPVPLHFEALPPRDPKNELIVQNNLFARARQLVRVDHFLLEPPNTSARWIWFNEATGDPSKEAPRGQRYFRRAFVVPARLASPAVLSIACDDNFTVWVNGQEVGKGQHQLAQRTVFAFDISRHMRQGKNVLAVQGTNIVGPAGLLVQLPFTPEGTPERTLVSDGTWSASTSGPKGWQELDFDDTSWTSVRAMAPYHKGPPGWQHFTWQAMIQQQSKGHLWPLIAHASGNISCKGAGIQGSIGLLETRALGDDKVLSIDAANDSRFLRYARTTGLFRAGPNNTPVGVPPGD